MFNLWAFALLFAAVVVMALSVKTPRAWLWIGLGGASFLASSLYWDMGDPKWHPPFAFFCDALTCLAFHVWAKERWELGVFACFLTSCFVSIVMIAGWLPNTVMYASLMEVCNWASLIIIGGIGLMDLLKVNEDSVVSVMRGSLHSPRRAL